MPAALDIVDVHAHIFPAGLPDLYRETADHRWPRLSCEAQAGRIMCGDSVFRQVRPPLWDLDARLEELDTAGVGVQLVSPVPVTLTYWADSKQATRFARAYNDGIAAQVEASRGRLVGLGTVPLPDIDAAIAELDRLVTELGMAGAEIGTLIAGRELDDPHLRPFFAAAEELHAVLAVHPMDGGTGVVRRAGQPYDFGLGMLTDTALAAGALVFGGVLDKHPGLRFVMAHGCGGYAWAFPRLRMAAQLAGERRVERIDELTRALWVDALVFDPVHLGLLVHRFGGDHVMVGTDHPFVPGQLAAVPELVRNAVAMGIVADDQVTAILSGNAGRLLKLSTAP